eukprot:TRINITY_DN23162_c0_g1_i1.p1 TRINITY_DN23162_c0_g1~~TRINITY_DN23162_c0_g1_i1.p1  ORF type:complete len:482 (+),score=130.66 TRINITY_DN23162_c0_g1_i1:55-1446(+)
MADGDEAAYLQRHQVPELVDAALQTVLDKRPDGPPGGVCAISVCLHRWFEDSCVQRRRHEEVDAEAMRRDTLPCCLHDDDERSREGSAAEVVPERPPPAPETHPLSRTVASPYMKSLRETAAAFGTNGRGALLSICDSSREYTRRLREHGVENGAEVRRSYREGILCHEGLGDYLSVVMLQPEALEQVSSTLRPFAEVVDLAGVVVGVTVDEGCADLLGGDSGEQCSAVLQRWPELAPKFYAQGCRAAHCRVPYRLHNGSMSEFMIHFNAHTLAAFAAESQRHGLVPVLSPSIGRDGAHDIGTAEVAAERVWTSLAAAIPQHGAVWDKLVVAVTAVMPGTKSPQAARASEIARCTVRALARCIPPACAAIAVTDEGMQNEQQASECLNAFHATKPCWPVLFLFGNSLEDTATKLWKGDTANLTEASRCFQLRSRMNFLAAQGRYVTAEDGREMKVLLSAASSY